MHIKRKSSKAWCNSTTAALDFCGLWPNGNTYSGALAPVAGGNDERLWLENSQMVGSILAAWPIRNPTAVRHQSRSDACAKVR